MKLQLKSIKYSPSLSQETHAFTANVYLNNKKVGYARNDGIGGCTFVTISEGKPPTNDQILAMLDVIDPNPTEYKKNEKNGTFELVPVTTRSEYSRSLDTVVDILVQNFVALREIKKYQNKVTAIFDENEEGAYMIYKSVTPKTLTPEKRAKIEQSPGFKRFLFDAPLEVLAEFIGRDPRDPLTTSVEIPDK